MNINLIKVSNALILKIILLILFIIIFFPFFWIILTSLKETNDIFAIPPRLIPSEGISFNNYDYAIYTSHVFLYTLNSIVVSVATIVLAITCTILGAYALARYNFIGKKIVYALISFTQIFPIVVLLIPLYMVCRAMRLYNTLLSLIFSYTAIMIPVAIILLISYLRDIPREIEEAANIDGCSRMGIILRIVIPLAQPGIVALTIFLFITIWQEYLLAVSFLGSQRKFTLPVGLAAFQGQYSTQWGPLMATAVIIAVPALIAFLSVQKHFINNLAGSVKG